MSARVILCGSTCGHEHNSLNGPSGCCPKGHGPYLYYCPVCHDEWARNNPERVAEIARLAAKIRRAR